MAEYRLTTTDMVVRTKDGAYIPNDPANRDRSEYDKWLAAGGVPDPYIPQPPSPPSPEVTVLFDHENRILAQEGLPPLTMADFVTKMSAPPAPAKAKRGK